MKHCKNCEYCELDLVSHYITGIKVHRCLLTGSIITEPFWNKCDKYTRKCAKDRNFIKLR